jgi:hypothetical protein
MALLGTAYSVAPYPRTPQQIVEALFQDQHEKPATRRPKPRDKRLRASLARNDEGKMAPAFDEVFLWLRQEVEQRHAGSHRPVVLMDGDTEQWQAADEILGDLDAIPILDLLHVTPRLWEATKILYRNKQDREQFVRSRLLRILQGKVRSVVKGIRRLASTRSLSTKNRRILRRIARYFENNAARMRYDDYLARGLPIATGVIEGACRHLVRDRLERTGMRWGLPGAQAMLDLRSVRLSNSWSDFISYYNQLRGPNPTPASTPTSAYVVAHPPRCLRRGRPVAPNPWCDDTPWWRRSNGSHLRLTTKRGLFSAVDRRIDNVDSWDADCRDIGRMYLRLGSGPADEWHGSESFAATSIGLC